MQPKWVVSIHHGSLAFLFGGVREGLGEAEQWFQRALSNNRRKKPRGPQPTIRLWKLVKEEVASATHSTKG